MNSHLISPLFTGPVDIIGDVHGELEALQSLLTELGYSAQGAHPEGRRLVFVGDLCDRGPDSPGVLRKVKSLIDAKVAQCVLGNHELNLLLGKRRHGNHWFEGLTEDAKHPELGCCAALSFEEQSWVISFLESLPLALEREDLRVVHAAWHEPSIEMIRLIPDSVKSAYLRIETAIEQNEEGRIVTKAAHKAQHELKNMLTDRSAHWTEEHRPLIKAMGELAELMQLSNPIRVLTSGLECRLETPFYSGGKWRFADRVPWWESYEGVPAIFGHYWRWYDPKAHEFYNNGRPSLFIEEPPFMAEHHRAFCIDFSVGGRFKERQAQAQGPYHSRLAALRWPERTLMYDGPHPRRLGS